MIANENYPYESGYLTQQVNDDPFAKEVLEKINEPDFEEYFGKPVRHFETIIISDIHLGSKVSRAKILVDFLETISFDRLIINGDVFDSINMRRLNRHHWKVLSRLRALTDSDKHKEVIWIRGNHDGFSDLLTQLMGIKVFNEYQFNWHDQKVIVLHGDIFDTFMTKFRIIADIADYIYRFFIYLDPVKMRFGRWLKRNSKAFIRNTQIVRTRAVNYARHKNANVIICGHTHHAEDSVLNGVRYLNSGSWTDSPAHFIGLADDQIKVISYY